MTGDRPALLVCSSGGHLAQLHALAPRLDVVGDDRLWVTFDAPQARSLLHGERYIFVRYTRPRDLKNVARNTCTALRLLAGQRFRVVVSTGSGIALSFLPLAVALGHKVVYIESATRTTGPSLTGRMLAVLPRIALFTQYESWANARWRYIGSLFDGFASEPSAEQRRATALKIVVTLGTIEGFGFERLLRRALAILPQDASVIWQVGDTDVTSLGIDGVKALPADELAKAVRDADVVISHAGTGSALMSLEQGKCPILVPRLASHQEHVDDHQVDIAAELAARGLAIFRHAENLTADDLVLAMSVAITRATGPPMNTGLV